MRVTGICTVIDGGEKTFYMWPGVPIVVVPVTPRPARLRRRGEPKELAKGVVAVGEVCREPRGMPAILVRYTSAVEGPFGGSRFEMTLVEADPPIRGYLYDPEEVRLDLEPAEETERFTWLYTDTLPETLTLRYRVKRSSEYEYGDEHERESREDVVTVRISPSMDVPCHAP